MPVLRRRRRVLINGGGGRGPLWSLAAPPAPPDAETFKYSTVARGQQTDWQLKILNAMKT